MPEQTFLRDGRWITQSQLKGVVKKVKKVVNKTKNK